MHLIIHFTILLLLLHLGNKCLFVCFVFCFLFLKYLMLNEFEGLLFWYFYIISLKVRISYNFILRLLFFKYLIPSDYASSFKKVRTFYSKK